ncbi:trypsin-like peptidase domain-containing protein [Octadecabacter sp. CECT 8868]|uniref:trypsin-like peptidase domain-containing protein n=1 Tax=Octadecabacter algicola TaxID=2909342 RepID=UPI001F413D39|nr:trypsin-like peptidase domain-containing protein [Octadecabacter algicola]MCF2906504.1 trypsin-like peptidase domain-containing protein [Octadecabacter algicola]
MQRIKTQHRSIGALSVIATLGAMVSTSAMAAANGGNGYVELVEDVSPAVVFVEVTASVQLAGAEASPMDDPRFEEFMKRFGGEIPQQGRSTPQQGVGSGFIISDDGLIVTNHHVIDGAAQVTIKMADGEEYDATIIGSDPLTDIALLDIEGDDFPTVSFGSSDELRVGEEVIAVGSPFGLGGTVTSGIISAKSRNINAGPFDDYIQTDAAINRGNSGGPLFNMDGEVVGVNTAIYSPDGGSVGIGFSVPADLVTNIVADLKDDGEIERSWLGVQIKPVSEDVAHVLGLKAGEGVMVEDVVADSPAEAAGIENGDVILRFAGQDIVELRDLTRGVANEASGSVAEIEVFRGGEQFALEVTLETREDKEA